MKKTIISLCCLLLAIPFAFAGCGDKESSAQETTAKPTQPTTAATQPATTKPVETTAPATADSAMPDEGDVTYDSFEIKKNLNDIESSIGNILTKNDFKGSMYVKIGNDFDYISSKGAASKGAHIDNSIYSTHYVGSATKLVTAIAVMKLVEEKKIDLNSSIEKYFPKCHYAKSITVKQLLTMTSGIPDYVQREQNPGQSMMLVPELDKIITDADDGKNNKKTVLNWILSQKPVKSGDSEFAYSDSNYFLLGEIIASASKQDYASYVKDTVFKKSLISKSGFSNDALTASSYPSNPKAEKLCYSGVGYASLGMISNVSDVLRLIDSLMSHNIISEKSVKEMFTDYGNGFGYGVYVSGNRVYCLGQIDSFGSKISFTTDQSIMYIAMSNYAETDINLIHRLFKNYMAKYRN